VLHLFPEAQHLAFEMVLAPMLEVMMMMALRKSTVRLARR